jgi:hypothetical protein
MQLPRTVMPSSLRSWVPLAPVNWCIDLSTSWEGHMWQGSREGRFWGLGAVRMILAFVDLRRTGCWEAEGWHYRYWKG